MKTGRSFQPFELSDLERERLTNLYIDDGGWTVEEAKRHFPLPRLEGLLKAGILVVQRTEIGAVILLGTLGRQAVFGVGSGCVNLDSQVNRTYRRLAVKRLGWRVIEASELGFELPESLASRRLFFCETDAGLALVGGQLTGNGYSTAYLRRLVVCYRSTALAYGFKVAILMPSKRRGQSLARKFGEVLDVVHVLPDVGEGRQIRRVTAPAKQETRTPEGPYLAGEAWRDDPQLSTLPGLIRQTLQLPRAQRIEQAMAALECDDVMTAAQLRRFYALSPQDLPGIYQVPTVLCPVPTQLANEVRINFLTLSKSLAGKNNFVLCHRCGTGQMRHLLNLPPDMDRYHLEPRSRLKYEEPDAIWESVGGQRYALEYDHGTYSPLTVGRKIDTFQDREFTGIIWGVGSPQRQRNLQAKIGDQLHRPVMLVEWWR